MSRKVKNWSGSIPKMIHFWRVTHAYHVWLTSVNELDRTTDATITQLRQSESWRTNKYMYTLTYACGHHARTTCCKLLRHLYRSTAYFRTLWPQTCFNIFITWLSCTMINYDKKWRYIAWKLSGNALLNCGSLQNLKGWYYSGAHWCYGNVLEN